MTYYMISPLRMSLLEFFDDKYVFFLPCAILQLLAMIRSHETVSTSISVSEIDEKKFEMVELSKSMISSRIRKKCSPLMALAMGKESVFDNLFDGDLNGN